MAVQKKWGGIDSGNVVEYQAGRDVKMVASCVAAFTDESRKGQSLRAS